MEPIKDFSGGEKARVALALIVWQKPNLLLLDEPTNHLDLEMRQALTMALQGYEGALVVISHDRHLLRNTVDQFYLVANGEVQEFDGDLQDYQVWLKNYNRTPDAQVKNSVPDNSVEKLSGAEKKAQRQQSAEARKKIAPLNKKSQQLEKEIEKNEKQLADVEHELADTDLYTDAKKEALKMLLDRQAKTKKAIADKEAEWLEIQTQIEAMS